ncbi:hypothetical protein [Cohaesibacter gelatinilyticus]|uniref:Peptidase U49 n=1 Tax=Cohaesibacter gelatinilyticus TaxID=372072 RepID=A0A285NDB1_9HYPH|nr:hypothetical protein [Cohaesibacter gelatinilyticus]SNZ07419.1 Peptidase U49 [Cohaesibacter gelatinilyticus]
MDLQNIKFDLEYIKIDWVSRQGNSHVFEDVYGNLHVEICSSIFERAILLSRSLALCPRDKNTKSNFNGFDVRACLDWVILHELQHWKLGHFELLNGVPTLHLISRSKRSSNPINSMPKELWHKVEPCLELQADHDAIDFMLDRYSTDGWQGIRTKATSIAAAMVLIEKIDTENGIKHSTHPKAATRIFQLLGHLTEMWSIPAHIIARNRNLKEVSEGDLPSKEEQQAFGKEVILPAFWDAVALAEIADAKTIVADLGSPEDFFADISCAKLGRLTDLQTTGAKEWADLKNTNAAILNLLDYSSF